MAASAAKLREWKRVEKLQIPSSKFQRTSKNQTPNTKLQTPKKSQVPSSKPRPALRAWDLELGASLVFGAWFLVFRFQDFSGAWCPLPRRGEREKTLRRNRSLGFVVYPADC